MDKNKNVVTEAQKVAQKKYDQKTKMISAKYVLSDMSDYDRLMKYLEKAGQSTNSFIKMLINGFFEKGYDKYRYPTPKEYELMTFYKYSEITDECLEKLKRILNNDESKYNIIFDMYANYTESEIETALLDKACEFKDWVNDLEEYINSGEISMESDEAFAHDFENEMCRCLREIMYA